MIKRLACLTAIAAATLAALPASAALVFGVNPSTPLSGYDLGGGSYATKVGLQFHTSGSFVGQTITLADLNSAIVSGSVSAWYYAAGNAASAMFGDIDAFAPFVADEVVAGSGNANRVWDALYAVHTDTVVFRSNPNNNGRANASIGGQRIEGNPFVTNAVPVPGTLLLAALGLGVAGWATRRRAAA